MGNIKTKIYAFLHWSQQYTRMDMVYLFKGVSWVTFAQLANGFLSLLLLIAFANLIPKETYGIYRYALSLVGILNIFTLSGMNAAVARTVAKGDEGVLRPAVTYQMKWNSCMLIALSLLGGYYFIQGDPTLATSILILGLFVPFTLAFNTYGAYLEGKKRFDIANITSILSTLVYSLGVLLTLLVTDQLLWIVAVYSVATFVPSLVFYLYVIYKFNPPTADDVNGTLKYGRELTYLRFIDPVVSQIDKIVLAHFWGPAQLATYSLATAIPNRATLFMKSWVAIGFAKFSEKTPSEINKVFLRRIFQGMATGLIIALVYIGISPYIFKYLLPQYLEGVFYSQLLAVSFIFAIPNRYMSLLFTSQGMSNVLFKRTTVLSIINASLYAFFGFWGGLFGLVLANILVNLAGFTLNIVMWRSVSKPTLT